jgi:hypothetical protein
MRYYKKTILYAVIIVLVLSFFMLNSVALMINVTVTPEEPEPLSTVKINANITIEENIEQVYIKIGECEGLSLCHSIQNLSMQKNKTLYSISYQLLYPEATFFKYSLNIKTEERWIETEYVNYSLETEDEENNNAGSTNNDDNAISGFGIILFLVALFLSFVKVKKRDKR